MGRKLFPLREAIMVPFITVIIVTIAVMTLIWNSNYDRITQEQSVKILTALNKSTEERLNFLLSEPMRLNKKFARDIADGHYYNMSSEEPVRRIAMSYANTLSEELGQIGGFCYGDENSNFVWIRVNDEPGSYSLMIQDESTDGVMHVYSGETMLTKRLASFEGYDPRIRPWYSPVKENYNVKWSDIYLNYDEKMEPTITSVMPIFNENKKLAGVSGVDVKLSGINQFLKENLSKGQGAIYIINDQWEVVAHSAPYPIYKVVWDNSAEAKPVNAKESRDKLIKESASYLNSHYFESDQVINMTLEKENYFAFVSELEQPKGLDWRIISVISENDLMGDVKQTQNLTIFLTLAFVAVFSLIGVFSLSKILAPISKSAEAAKAIAGGDFNTRIEGAPIPVSETKTLIEAFNSMASTIRDSFQKIRMSEEKYRSLIENIDDMIFSISPDKKMLTVNSGFEKMLGKNREQIEGRDVLAIIKDPENQDRWNDALNKVFETREMFEMQHEFRNLQGRMTYLKVVLIPVIDEVGQVTMILGSNTDVTALVEAQNEIVKLHEEEKIKLEMLVEERTIELQMAMKELAEKEKLASLGSLVSGISHEINTPLGVAISAGSFLEEQIREMGRKVSDGSMTKKDFVKFMESVDETVSMINSNLVRAAALVKSFKQIAVNQSLEEEATFNVKEYVEALILSLKHELKYRKQKLTFNCPDDLVFRTYPGALSQILSNFIMNSLLHAYGEQDDGSMSIEITGDSDKMVIQYSDDGKGISPEVLPRIFEPFFTTKRHQGGSGLGLNIVYNIVTSQLNGKIECTSEPGKGTVFTVEIPMKK